MFTMKKNNSIAFIFSLLCSCNVSTSVFKKAEHQLSKESVISTGHIGISILEPATGKYLYQKNAEKYFIPASNVKLFTLYAGMKYLEDSLIGLQYFEKNDTVFIFPTGDPTFLHPEFTFQPVFDFFSKQQHPMVVVTSANQPVKYGKGWSWDDADESFMPQRNQFPMYGNLLQLECRKSLFSNKITSNIEPNLSDISINYSVDSSASKSKVYRVQNEKVYNVIFCQKDSALKKIIPFETNGTETTISFLKKKFNLSSITENAFNPEISLKEVDSFKQIKTQVSDSMFKYMMYNSDNFFAEQTLLMCCNVATWSMNEEEMIALLLSKECKDIPQKPRWVDGSGLSRYNLFSPNDFTYILHKLEVDFGEERIRSILPTGGKGTMKNFCLQDSGFIYAKTGSMSNVFCISGELLTKKNKKLLFAVMLNNYCGSSSVAKKAIENYLTTIRKKY